MYATESLPIGPVISQTMQMTSEATKRPWRPFLEVIFEISDLNYICCHVSLASKDFWKMIKTDRDQIRLIDFAVDIAPRVKIPLKITVMRMT